MSNFLSATDKSRLIAATRPISRQFVRLAIIFKRIQSQNMNKVKNFSTLRPTNQSLPISLLKTREWIMDEVRPVLHANDLTEQQWRVLRVVAEEGFADATTVASRACILAPSLTRILRNLTEKGVLGSTRDENDGRRLMIYLTPKGEELIATVSPQTWVVFERMRERVGNEKWEQLLELLKQVREEISQTEGEISNQRPLEQA